MGFSNRFKSPELPQEISPNLSRSPSNPFLQQTSLQDYLCNSPQKHLQASSALIKPLLTPIENLPQRNISPLSFKRMSAGSALENSPDPLQYRDSLPNVNPQPNVNAVLHKGRIIFRKDSINDSPSIRRVMTERAESPEIIKPVSPDKLPFMRRQFTRNNTNDIPIIRDKSLPILYNRNQITSAEDQPRTGRTSNSSAPTRLPSLDDGRGRRIKDLQGKRLVTFDESMIEKEENKYELPMTLNQVLSKIEAEIKEERISTDKYVDNLKRRSGVYEDGKDMDCMSMTFGKNFEENNGETNLNYLKGLNSSRQQNCPINSINQGSTASRSILRARKFRADGPNNPVASRNEELREEITLLKMQYEKETRTKSPNQKFTKAKRMQSIRNQN